MNSLEVRRFDRSAAAPFNFPRRFPDPRADAFFQRETDDVGFSFRQNGYFFTAFDLYGAFEVLQRLAPVVVILFVVVVVVVVGIGVDVACCC